MPQAVHCPFLEYSGKLEQETIVNIIPDYHHCPPQYLVHWFPFTPNQSVFPFSLKFLTSDRTISFQVLLGLPHNLCTSSSLNVNVL